MRTSLGRIGAAIIVASLGTACSSQASPVPSPTWVSAPSASTPTSAGGSAPSPTSSPTPSPTIAFVPPSWTATGATTTPHRGHTATLLRDGRVLVPNTGEQDVAELFDPATGTWSVTASIPGGRYRHSATLLANGKVLVVGGTDGRTGRPAAFVDLYDPNGGTWTETGALIEARAGHTATLLPDGRVLVAGGTVDPDGELVLASSELYDPDEGTWSPTAPMSVPRSAPAVLLRDGRVLVVGGITKFVNPMDSRALASAEIYDPAVGTWAGVAPLSEARFAHTATTLADGRVLVAFGT